MVPPSPIYGQGLLTYAILAGMRGPGLREGRYVDAQQLFSFVQEQVPLLAAGLGRRQQPLVSIPQQGSIDLGELDEKGVQSLPGVQALAVLSRPVLGQQEPPWDDPLGLNSRLESLFLEASAGTKPFVYMPVDWFSGSSQLRGRYSVEGDIVEVEFLWVAPDGSSGPSQKLKGSLEQVVAGLLASRPGG